MRVNELLKKERVDRKLTQKQFSTLLNIPYSTYCQYEQGFKIGKSHIVKIVKNTNIKYEQILEGQQKS